MAITAKILFKEHIPFRLEHELIHKRGFHVAYRLNNGVGVCLQKGYADGDHPTDDDEDWTDDALAQALRQQSSFPWDCDSWEDDLVVGPDPKNIYEIPETRTRVLDQYCMKVYDCFMEPYRQTDEIKLQLQQMCRNRRLSPIETEWVENWIYTNVL